MKQTSVAAVWHYMRDFPCADEANKGQRASAERSIRNAVERKGMTFDPGNIRPMTPDELSRTPSEPSLGVELRGLIYRFGETGQTNIDDLLWFA